MVEMAVVLTFVLLPLVGGIIDFGLFLFYQNKAAEIARGAARQAVVGSLNQSAINTAITTFISGYDPTFESYPTGGNAYGYSASCTGTPDFSSSTPVAGGCITVQIRKKTANYSPIFLKLVPSLKDSIPAGSATMRYE